MTIGERLKKIRKELNFTQKQLADKVGISLMSIQRYERDERQPTVEILEKICDALDVPVIDIIGPLNRQKPKSERELFKAVLSNIPSDKFFHGKTKLDHINKIDALIQISEIAELSNISIEGLNTYNISKKVTVPNIDAYPPDIQKDLEEIERMEFDGVLVTYNDKQFKISADEYYKLAERIIESVAVNILAAETYKKE